MGTSKDPGLPAAGQDSEVVVDVLHEVPPNFEDAEGTREPRRDPDARIVESTTPPKGEEPAEWRKAREDVQGEWRLRRNTGYLLGGGAIAGVVCVAYIALQELPDPLTFDPELTDGVRKHYFWTVFGAGLLIHVALVWFCYQLLGVAERLLIPSSVFGTEQERMLLGVKDPVRGIAQTARETAGVVKDLPLK